jgi:hypothetical protein
VARYGTRGATRRVTSGRVTGGNPPSHASAQTQRKFAAERFAVTNSALQIGKFGVDWMASLAIAL